MKYKNDKRMQNAYYWAAQIRGWLEDGPNAGIAGRYYVTVLAGRPVIVMDDSFKRSHAEAIRDGLREYGYPPAMKIRELSDEWRIFVEPTDDRLHGGYRDDWLEFEPHSAFADTAV